MESWDDEDFEPPAVVAPTRVISNKWEGEDEEEDVKESWEDEDEDKEPAKQEAAPPPKQKKKPLAEKIAEKERQRKEEMERRLKEQLEEDISPEERIRRQKESDLKLALETTFGGSNNNTNETIDGLVLPSTKEEFIEFAESLSKKLSPLSKNTEFPNFVENHVRNLCASMSSLDIKKIKNTLDNLFLEKQKIEKGDKSKKNKSKGKVKLRLEDENQLSAYVNDFEDFDDFM